MGVLPDIEKTGFTFRQQIVVHKGLQAVAGRTSSKLKMFPTATESIFYFHKESRDLVRDLIQSEMKRLGMKGKDVNALLGKATSGGGTLACIASMKKPLEHRVYPTKEDWEKLSTVMNLPKYEDTVYKFNIQSGLTDVWSDINFYDRKEKKFHSTQKPIKLMERLVKCSTNEGDTVLDIFSGSGSTGVACALNNRNFVGCEVDETYYEKSLERINSINPIC
jgi:adenine specific DNA methylase Mod